MRASVFLVAACLGFALVDAAVAEDVSKDNDGKIVGAQKAHKEAMKQVDQIDKDFEPKEKTLFEKTHERLEKAQKEGKVGK